MTAEDHVLRGPQARARLADLFARLGDATRPVLLLDYDGTLAPFRENPAQARPYPAVPPLLDAIAATATRVVIVSGRQCRDILPLLALSQRPEIWGSHGWERLGPDGAYLLADPGRPARALLADAERWGPAVAALGGRFERKPASIAFHWRGLPEETATRIAATVRAAWAAPADSAGLELHPFDGGIELRTPGRNKGAVVEAVLAETDPDAVVAYLGDDLTDEDAFRALKGRGLGVLVRAEPRATAADCWLKPPEELVEFLEQWKERCGGRP